MRFEQRYGQPYRCELALLAHASNFRTRAAKPDGALDFAQPHNGWAYKFARMLGVSLASVAPWVWHAVSSSRANPSLRDARGDVLSEFDLSRAAQQAVALAQQEKTTWTRADLIKYLDRVLPRSCLAPAGAVALLEDLPDRALRPGSEPVLCMKAPEAVEVPCSLLRADGCSVYQWRGECGTPRALAMEERMLRKPAPMARRA